MTDLKQGTPVLYNDGATSIPGRIGDLREYGRANIDLETGDTVWNAEQGEKDGQWRPAFEIASNQVTLPSGTVVDIEWALGDGPLDDHEKQALAEEYTRLTGKKPHHKMKLETLKAKVEELQAEEKATAPDTTEETEPSSLEAQ